MLRLTRSYCQKKFKQLTDIFNENSILSLKKVSKSSKNTMKIAEKPIDCFAVVVDWFLLHIAFFFK